MKTVDVIMNIQHPLRMKGFPAGYVMHFTEYIKSQF